MAGIKALSAWFKVRQSSFTLSTVEPSATHPPAPWSARHSWHWPLWPFWMHPQVSSRSLGCWVGLVLAHLACCLHCTALGMSECPAGYVEASNCGCYAKSATTVLWVSWNLAKGAQLPVYQHPFFSVWRSHFLSLWCRVGERRGSGWEHCRHHRPRLWRKLLSSKLNFHPHQTSPWPKLSWLPTCRPSGLMQPSVAAPTISAVAPLLKMMESFWILRPAAPMWCLPGRTLFTRGRRLTGCSTFCASWERPTTAALSVRNHQDMGDVKTTLQSAFSLPQSDLLDLQILCHELKVSKF